LQKRPKFLSILLTKATPYYPKHTNIHTPTRIVSLTIKSIQRKTIHSAKSIGANYCVVRHHVVVPVSMLKRHLPRRIWFHEYAYIHIYATTYYNVNYCVVRYYVVVRVLMLKRHLPRRIWFHEYAYIHIYTATYYNVNVWYATIWMSLSRCQNATCHL